jgi:NAD(P)-dependent dehydrogenase (short-subunit alcohol dehydrogenase family)
MQDHKVALVTGSSRGIGKRCAVWLAQAGYDVAITARTVNEGEEREHSSTLKKSKTTPLPGSLLATAALIEEAGRKALPVAADLLDTMTLGAAVATVLERWGRIDVVVHNGRYIGPGHMDSFLDTPVALLETQMKANTFAPLHINKMVLPGMIERGAGVIINITSGAAYSTISQPPGKGGHGLGYTMSKGAFHRVAGQLATELRDTGVKVYNVSPGFITTERMIADMGDFGLDPHAGAPADVIGAVVQWLVTSPEAPEWNGKNIEAQYFCHERNLLPSWPGPREAPENGNWDRSASDSHALLVAHNKKLRDAAAAKA